MRHTWRPLDSTWRLMWRDTPQGMAPEVDGRDCYVFRRAGGEKSSDVYSTHIIPVDTFWGTA